MAGGETSTVKWTPSACAFVSFKGFSRFLLPRSTKILFYKVEKMCLVSEFRFSGSYQHVFYDCPIRKIPATGQSLIRTLSAVDIDQSVLRLAQKA